MNKLIVSYDISTGIICFADGTKEQFKRDSVVMIDRMIYMLANNDFNFEEPDLAVENDDDVNMGVIQNELP